MKRTRTIAAMALTATLMSGAAFAMNQGDYMKPMQGKHQMMMNKEIPGISKETQKMLMDARKESPEKYKENMAQMKKEREALEKIITADTFDKKAFLSQKAKMDSLRDKMRNEKINAKADVYTKMSAAERKAWVKHRQDRMERRKQMRGKGMRKGMRKGGMMHQNAPSVNESKAPVTE